MTTKYKVVSGHKNDMWFVATDGKTNNVHNYLIEHICYSMDAATEWAKEANERHDYKENRYDVVKKADTTIHTL